MKKYFYVVKKISLQTQINALSLCGFTVMYAPVCTSVNVSADYFGITQIFSELIAKILREADALSFYTEKEQRNKSRFPNQKMRNAKYLRESENYILYNFLSMQTNFPLCYAVFRTRGKI